MGSFNAQCMVSRLPIKYRDPVYVLPLLKSRTDINDGIQEFYKIAGVPFAAEYNDYGYFADQDDDSYAFKQYLKLMNCDTYEQAKEKWYEISRDDDDDEHLTFCMIRKDIYEEMTKFNHVFPIDSYYHTMLHHSALTLLDFKIDRCENNVVFYSHTNIPNLVMKIDGSQGGLYHNDNPVPNMYDVEDYLRFITTIGVDATEYRAAISTVPSAFYHFLTAIEEPKAYLARVNGINTEGLPPQLAVSIFQVALRNENNTYRWKWAKEYWNGDDEYREEIKRTFFLIERMTHLDMLITENRYVGQEVSIKQYKWFHQMVLDKVTNQHLEEMADNSEIMSLDEFMELLKDGRVSDTDDVFHYADEDEEDTRIVVNRDDVVHSYPNIIWFHS